MCVFPFSNFDLGIYNRLSAPKYGWLNIGEGEGHIWVNKNFRENSREVVTVSLICEE